MKTQVIQQVEATRESLLERKINRPKTLKTLTNSLKTSAFAGRLSDEEIAVLLKGLEDRHLTAIQGQKIAYLGAFDD